MSQPFNADIVEVIVGEIQLESALKISDSSRKLIPAQSSD
jgi:hypothetical protein